MRLMWLILLFLGGLLVASRLSRPAATRSTADVRPLPAAPKVAVAAAARPMVVSVAVPPVVSDSRTPVIERLARAEARRRIGWAGRASYLDSAFTNADSVLRRWNDHPEVRVAVVASPDHPALVGDDGQEPGAKHSRPKREPLFTTGASSTSVFSWWMWPIPARPTS